MKNRLKTRLASGGAAIGTGISIGHPDVAEVIGQAGYDWVLIDTEHSPLSIETVQMLLQTMSFSPAVPVVRVAWNDMVMIKRALDVGAYGIVVPWVNTREEALRAVRSVRYPPEGVRGFGPRRASLNDPDYASTANREILLAVQVETQAAIDNLDEILSVEGIDAVLVGPSDLSLSLGILGKFNDPKYESALKRVVDSSKKHGVAPGMLAVDDVEKRLRQGFRLMCVSADLVFLKEGARRVVDEARRAMGESK